MKSWLKIASLSLVIGSVAVACTISEGDPDDDGIGGADVGEGGDEAGGADEGGAGTDASTGGTTATGGATATGGTTVTGGTTATGGSAGAEPGTGGSDEPNPCVECMQLNCEEQLNACAETTDTVGPKDADGDVTGPNDSPDCIDEFVSYQSCVEKAWKEPEDGGDPLYWNEANCDSAAVLVETNDPLLETNALINCVVDAESTAGVDCITECLDYSEELGAGGAGG
ncbi:MAG TPA: hypothetical protein PLU22_11500 [Polyangiaceae bacterium]|nr:hypothetical protein [Polyangiaceae bacterium]